MPEIALPQSIDDTLAPPIVIVTSNRAREIHDALKRRCLYDRIDCPDAARERQIVAAKAPDRGIPLIEPDVVALDPDLVTGTLGVPLKDHDIVGMAGPRTRSPIDEVRTELCAA